MWDKRKAYKGEETKMNNNFFTPGMPNELFNMWSNSFNKMMNPTKVETEFNGFNNIFKDSTENYAKLFSTWTDSFKQFQGMPNMGMNTSMFNFNDQQELMKKMFAGATTYQNLNNFWVALSTKMPLDTPEKVTAFAKQFEDQYMGLVKDMFIPMLPENMRSIFSQPMDLMNDYTKASENFMKPWVESKDAIQALIERGMKGDKDVYMDFYKLINENYDNSYGKLMNISGLGLNGESTEQQMKTFDSYIKLMICFNELFSLIYKVSQGNMEELVKKYQTMFEEGTMPQTFREFYDMWLKTNEDSFVSVFNTEEFAKLFGKFSEKYCEFKMKSDNLLEEQLRALPLPTKTDMDDLYKTVYDQKKELRSLKREMKAMNEKLQALSGIKPQVAENK